MKKYSICLLLLLGTSIVCILIGFMAMKNKAKQEQEMLTTIAETSQEIQTIAETQVVNQNEIQPVLESETAENQFCLVSETGYLLVFSENRSKVCLYTHIPISDFPEKEQERLREGIWFSSMMEVFHYLESFTS